MSAAATEKIMENPLDANNSAVADLLMAEARRGQRPVCRPAHQRRLCRSRDDLMGTERPHTGSEAGPLASGPRQSCVIDLVAGDMGNLYSWVYYFMQPEFDKINPEISRRLRHEIKSRVLDPFPGLRPLVVGRQPHLQRPYAQQLESLVSEQCAAHRHAHGRGSRPLCRYRMVYHPWHRQVPQLYQG